MPQEQAMHYFWANFTIPSIDIKTRWHYWTIEELEKIKDFDLSKTNLNKNEKILALRNCVEPKTWKIILDAAMRNISLF